MALETLGLGGILKMDTRTFTLAMSKAKDSFAKLKQGAERMKPSAAGLSTAFASMATTIRAAGAKVIAAARAMATKVGAQFKRMRGGAAQVGRGLAQVGGAMRSGAMAALPLAAGMGFAVKQAADFEKQMSAVGGVLLLQPEQMTDLASAAKRMGIESVFSASQSAEAMESMARAGFNSSQIIKGLGGVMDAAAAEGIGLATATDIVASTVKGFGMTADDATGVADILALASARANTNIVGLGEGMKFVAPIARGLGVSIHETTASLALLADSGLKGTLAGTALKNALLKLAAPTGKGAKRLKELGLRVSDAQGNFVGMNSILKQLSTGLDKMGGKVNRTAAAAELFGLRGVALTNLLGRLDEKTSDGAMTFAQFTKALEDSSGAAKKMAEIRLKNLSGAVTLLTSSLEGVSIALFGEMLKPLAASTRNVTDALNSVLFVFNDLTAATDKQRGSVGFLTSLNEKYGSTAVQVALGVRDAVEWMRGAWNRVVSTVKQASAWVRDKFGDEGIRRITKLAIVIGTAAAAFTPVLIAALGFAFVLTAVVVPAASGLAAIISGIGTVLGAVFSGPGLAVIATAAFLFGLIRKEGESAGQTIIRVFRQAHAWVSDTWTNAVKPFLLGIKEGFTPAIYELGAAWDAIRISILFAIREISGEFGGATEGMEINWREVGRTIGAVLGAVISAAATVVSGVVQIGALASTTIIPFGKITLGWLVEPFSLAGQVVGRVVTAVKEIFSGSIVSGLQRLGAALVDFLLSPMRLMLRQAIKFADFLPGIKIPAALRTFAEEGISGFLFPEEPKAGVKIAAKGAAAAGEAARTITKARAKEKAEAVKRPEEMRPSWMDEVVGERKTTVNVKSDLRINGREAAYASAEHTQEIQERAGFKATPWQRRLSLEQGLPALVAIPRG